MYRNQDILRIYTSNQLGAYNEGTSIVMLPVRIETKFANRIVEVSSKDPHQVFFIFEAIWELFKNLDKNRELSYDSSLCNLEKSVGCIEAIYKEDQSYVLELLDIIKECICSNHKQRVQVLIQSIEEKAVVNENKANRATMLLKKTKLMSRRMKSLLEGKAYSGIMRSKINMPYSISVHYRNTYRRLKEIISFLNSFNSELAKIPFIDNRQRKAFLYQLNSLKEEALDENFWINNCNPIVTLSENRNSCNESMQAREKNLMTAYKDCKKKHQELRNLCEKISISELDSKLRLKCTKKALGNSALRYTQVAKELIKQCFVDSNLTNAKNKKMTQKISNVIFDYHIEFEWLREVLVYYNNTLSKKGASQFAISTNLLKKNIKYIQKRKLVYKEERKCLCVRFYPDELAVTKLLNNDMTAEEINNVNIFFKEYAGEESKDKDTKQAAWDRLCMKYPPHKAAWLVRCRTLYPDKKAIDNKQVFSIPVSKWLPNRFSLQAYIKINNQKEQLISYYGNRLPEVLTVGLDLNKDKQAKEHIADVASGHIKFKNELNWMTDFNEAERIGMAMSIPLSGFKFGKNSTSNKQLSRNYEFNSIFVTGVKEGLNVDTYEGDELLYQLFHNQLFSEKGMDLIKYGTPTNILTSKNNTNFDSTADIQKKRLFNIISSFLNVTIIKMQDGSDSYRGYWQKDNDNIIKDNDANIINKLFGYSPGMQQIFETLNADNKDVLHARKANKYLLDKYEARYPGTILSEIKNSIDVYNYFCNYVLARGNFSNLRIGSQPYGLLLVSDFSNIRLRSSSMNSVKAMLTSIAHNWNRIAEQNTVIEPKNDTTDFFQLMGKTPTSSTFYEQQTVMIEDLLKPEFFNSLNYGMSTYGSSLYKYRLDNYIPLKDEKFITLLEDNNNPLFKDVEELMRHFASEGDIINEDEAKQLIVEFFDLFNHRLDAWMQGLLAYMQHEREKINYKRIALGVYGWIFDLKEDSKKNTDLGEHLLAPSVNQAVTAAVLKSAYNNRQENNTTDSRSVNINISSSRVRKAKRIIEGVRNGLPIGAVLGADLERYLHNAYKETGVEMDIFIYPLRKAFPLYDNATPKTDTSSVVSSSPTVINGALMLESIFEKMKDDDKSIEAIFEQWCSDNKLCAKQGSNNALAGLNTDTKKLKQLLQAVQEVFDSYDAVMDVILSDGIYHLCQGNNEAAAAIMNAMKNDTALPMPSVTEVPITSARIEYKMIAIMGDQSKLNCQNATPLAIADLYINQWAGRIIGQEHLNLYKIGLQPADIIYLSNNKSGFIKYIEYLGDKYSVDKSILAAEFEQLEWVVNSIREQLTSSHIISSEDFMQKSPAERVYNNYDTEELLKICSNLKDMLKARMEKLIATLVIYEDRQSEREAIESVNADLWECYALGYSQVPEIIANEKLFEAAQTFAEVLKGKLSYVEEFFNNIKLDKQTITVDAIHQAICKLTSPSIKIAPLLKLDKQVEFESIKLALGNDVSFNANEDNLHDFICEMADIRPAMRTLYNHRLYSECNNAIMNLGVMQIPLLENESGIIKEQQWLGFELEDESKVYDANAYLLLNPEILSNTIQQGTNSVRGLVFDFWTEKIPLKHQTGGLTFHFDQPDAEPAQAILYAMSPGSRWNSIWTEKRMRKAIKSALHMIKSRAVEPDDLMRDAWASSIFPIFNPLTNNNHD